MNQWERVKTFWSGQSEAHIILRREYMAGIPELTVERKDEYRCLLERAGYLEHAGVGKYRRCKEIPAGLTVEQVRDQAYPNRKKRGKNVS